MTGEQPTGYRPEPVGGPRLRSDIIEVFIFRAQPEDAGIIELLLLERAGAPLGRTWQPVMGHIESGETAVQSAARELREEVALDVRDSACQGLWAMEQVHPYYVATIDSILLSPRFAVKVAPTWEPVLNSEHSDRRWVCIDLRDPAPALAQLMWPGQKHTVREMLAEIVNPGAVARDRMAIDLSALDS